MEMKINIFQEWLICLTLRSHAEIHGIQNRGNYAASFMHLAAIFLTGCT